LNSGTQRTFPHKSSKPHQKTFFLLIQRLRRSVALHGNNIEIPRCFGINFSCGYVTEEHRMPGNPKECREHAKRCLKIAQEALIQL